MNENSIHYEYGHKTILELRNLQEDGHLNLEPGFQRKSVWTGLDRRKLIQSILEGYPVPSIFLYRREENGMPIYDVLDGKQRLETIFMFSRVSPFKHDGFDVKFRFPDDDVPYWYDWKAVEKYGYAADFLTYKIQVAEVRGELSDIIELFVRINSTGKALTSSERRHARYYTSPFLREAEKLSRRLRRYMTSQRIVSPTHIDRMKDVELLSELLASIVAGGPIHKKQAIDRAVGNQTINAHTLKKAVRELVATMTAIRRLFPNLRNTRFHNMAEFYTLFMVVWDLQQQKLVLTDRRRNEVAARLIEGFSNGVDLVREQQRKTEGAKPHQRLFAEYLLMVQAATDNLSQRKGRAAIIRGLLGGLFEKKDDRRIFSPEQRRLLWNSEEKKRCSQCNQPLDWSNFQVDHIKAHCLGGKTDLPNAALICKSCNCAKGARRRAKRKRKAA